MSQTYRCAVLDDYQNVALKIADWSPLGRQVDVKVFNTSLGEPEALASALQGFDIICAMRERTLFPRALFEKLPNLKLLVTTGLRNAAIDLIAAKDHGVLVCGTETSGHATAELTIGLMIDLARHISLEAARMKAGEALKGEKAWQSTIGLDLYGKTLGIIGLGKLGSRVARIAQALGMNVMAWSQNLTPEKCQEAGVAYATKEALLREADFITIHTQLSARTKGLIGAAELAQMKPTAFLINTSRGPIIDEPALIVALRENRIAGAALDVFDTEPLARDHPFRTLRNALITPHLGYVTLETYRIFYSQTVEDIRAFLDGKPVRMLG